MVTIDYRDIPFRFRANPRDPSITNPDGSHPRRFPDFGNFRLWYGEGEASYDGANISFRARVSQKLELQGFYTYSEAEGNVLAGADEFRLTDVQLPAELGRRPRRLRQPARSAVRRLLRSAQHRRPAPHHPERRLPGTVGNQRGPVCTATVRPRRTRSSRTDDPNGDGFIFDLFPGDHVNSKRADSISQFDLRLAKEFTFGGGIGLELIAEMFNVFNEENPAGFGISGQPSTFAGDPLQGEHQLIQLGARVRF